MNKDLVVDRYGRYYQIPKYLSDMDNDVTVICLDYHSSHYQNPEPNKDGSLTVISHSTGRASRLIGFLRYVHRLRGYLQANRPDVLIGGSDALQIIAAAYLSGSLNTRLILDLYDNYEAYPLTQLPFIRSLYRQALNKAEAIAVITPELENYIRRLIPDGTTRVIGNAVDADFKPGPGKSEARNILKLPPRGILVGTAGDLSRKRGIDNLISAFNLLHSEDEEYYLVLAGKLERGVSTESPAGKILYLGELDYKYMPVLFNALDIGVVYNLDDKFGKYCHPQKACEMIACQLPIVAANVGYMSRVLQDIPEILFTPGDYATLAEAIKYQAKRKVISNLTIDSWQQQAVSLYRLLENSAIS